MSKDLLIGLDDRDTPDTWTRRLKRDASEIARRLPHELLEIHRAVIDRARDAAAHALTLSGSTARSRRTRISDLDYHVIGPRILTRDLSSQLDLHTLTPAELDAHILAGDDFVQWSLRFGLIVFDDGHLRRAAALIATRRPWPDADRKRAHAAKSVDLARRMVASGDVDAALEQVRTALSLAARARLLRAGYSLAHEPSCRSSWRSSAWPTPAPHSPPRSATTPSGSTSSVARWISATHSYARRRRPCRSRSTCSVPPRVQPCCARVLEYASGSMFGPCSRGRTSPRDPGRSRIQR
jgi:hypothetical protein